MTLSRPSLDELQALARAVALDASLCVVEGVAGSGWFIVPSTGVISADGDDLRSEHPDELRGLACHEAAHAAVTRYDRLVPQSLIGERPGLASLLNALEDCRIEAWLQRRLPGTRPWIDRYNDRLFPEDGGALARAPWFRQFCLGAIHEWWHGRLPPDLAEPVVEALAATRTGRQAVVDAQPPVEPRIAVEGIATYRSHPVARVFSELDGGLPPDPFERAVRLSAYDAWHVTWTEVRPTYESLVRADTEHLARLKQLERSFLSRLSGIHRPILGRRARRPPRPVHGPPPSAVPGTGSERLPELAAHTRRRLGEAEHAEAGSSYEAARRAVAPLVDRTVEALSRALRRDAHPRWMSGYPTGSRIDLASAMQLDADRARIDRLWQRKTVPRKRDPAFMLLLDLSGSMGGEPIAHGFRGVVLLAEVLDRLGVPFEVQGFQDVPIPFKEFSAPLDATCRARLSEMPAEVEGRRRGGRNRPEHNWDGPVLERTANRLMAQAADHRVLIVVSDGIPSGPGDGEGALRQAIDSVEGSGRVHLLGVGLGPGTAHVARFYPEHLANVPLEGLPEVLGRSIDVELSRARSRQDRPRPSGDPR